MTFSTLCGCFGPAGNHRFFCSFLAGLAVGVSVGVSYGSTNGRVGDFSSCVLWGVQDLCGLEKPLVRADPGTCGAVGTACPA